MTAAPPPAPTHVREDPRFAEPRPQHHPRRVAATPTTPSTRPTTTFPLDADVPPAPSSSRSPTDGVGVGVGVGARANGKAAAAAAATTTTTREAEDDATVPSSDADAAEDPPDPAATIADLRRKLLAASNVRAAMEAALDESEARTREARASEAAETAARLAAAEARCEDVLLAANRAVDAARNRQTAAERRANEMREGAGGVRARRGPTLRGVAEGGVAVALLAARVRARRYAERRGVAGDGAVGRRARRSAATTRCTRRWSARRGRAATGGWAAARQLALRGAAIITHSALRRRITRADPRSSSPTRSRSRPRFER